MIFIFPSLKLLIIIFFVLIPALFQAPLNAKRLNVVRQGWEAATGGAGESAEISPSGLREAISFETHPEVLREPGEAHQDRLAQQRTTRASLLVLLFPYKKKYMNLSGVPLISSGTRTS